MGRPTKDGPYEKEPYDALARDYYHRGAEIKESKGAAGSGSKRSAPPWRLTLAAEPSFASTKNGRAESFKIGRSSTRRCGSASGRALTARLGDSPPTRLMAANERYGGVDLGDPMLSDDLLTDILVNGVVSGSAIQAHLDQHPFFADASMERPWRVIWYGRQHSDAEVANAVRTMEQQFANREIVIPGEILHVFGLRFFLAEIGVLPGRREELNAEARRYIDDLFAQEKLEPLEPEADDGFELGGYGGAEIYQSGSEDMRALREYLRQKRVEAAERLYPAQGAELLALMKASPDTFQKKLLWTDEKAGTYARVPVMQGIPPQDFVRVLLLLHPAQQRVVFRTLYGRYAHNALRRDLQAELPWLRDVVAELGGSVVNLSPYPKWRTHEQIARLAKIVADAGG